MNKNGNGSTSSSPEAAGATGAGNGTDPGTTGIPPLPVSTVAPAQATAALTTAMTQIQTVFEPLVNILYSLSTEQRRRVLKAHTGIEPQATALAEMILGKPSLAPVNLDPQQVLDHVAYCNKLVAFNNLLGALLKTGEDTLLVNRSQLYQDSLDIYTIDTRNARRDPSIQPYLEKFAAFMKLGPRKTRSGQPQVNGKARNTKAAADARRAASGKGSGSTDTAGSTNGGDPATSNGSTATPTSSGTSANGPTTTPGGVPVFTPVPKA